MKVEKDYTSKELSKMLALKMRLTGESVPHGDELRAWIIAELAVIKPWFRRRLRLGFKLLWVLAGVVGIMIVGLFENASARAGWGGWAGIALVLAGMLVANTLYWTKRNSPMMLAQVEFVVAAWAAGTSVGETGTALWLKVVTALFLGMRGFEDWNATPVTTPFLPWNRDGHLPILVAMKALDVVKLNEMIRGERTPESLLE